MSHAEIGRSRQARSGWGGSIVAALVAIVLVALAVWYVLAGLGTYAPSAPYQTAAPGTAAPATGAPRYP